MSNSVKRLCVLLLCVAVPYAIPGAEAQAYSMVQVPDSVLQRYAGEWVYPAGNSVSVVLEGSTLYRVVPGQKVPFLPISETKFRLGPVFTAEFVIDKAGGLTQILSDGAATEYRLHRKGSRVAAVAVAQAVRVPKSVLERYVGRYEYLPGQMSRTDLFILVRLKEDTLLGVTGQEDVLTPLSDTRFKLGRTSIEWEFVVDEKGGVTLIMGTGFQQMKAGRT